MGNVVLGHVLQDGDELLSIVSAYLRCKTTKFGNIFIKLPTICQLQHDQISFLLRTVLQLKFGLGSELDHVDEKRVFEFVEEVDLELVGLLLAGSWEVNLEGVEAVVLAAEVDAGLASLSELQVQGVVVNAAQQRIVVLWLHSMYYKRIPTFDQAKSFIKEIIQDKSNSSRSPPPSCQKHPQTPSNTIPYPS